MSIIANYHTHNQLCNHAVGNCEDYVKEAIRLGMKEIGLSDHDPIPREFMTEKEYIDNWCQRNMTIDQFYNVYLPEQRSVVEKYSSQIKIYRGLECEYFKEHDDFYRELRSHLDYMLYGVHFFKNKKGEVINSYACIDYKNVNEYADACVDGMESGLFQILVHPDLFMFAYKNVNGERKFDEAAIEASRRIIESAIKNNVYLEVNCNGISNSVKYNSPNWLYPYDEFWKLAKEYKELKVCIGIDAHKVEALNGDDLNQVIEFTKRLGLNVSPTVKFTK